MPFYDLKCTKCNHTFTKRASMSQRENKDIECPECKCNELEAVFKNVNVVHSRKDSVCPNIDKCGGCCS